mgnify:CR=1 FL=1
MSRFTLLIALTVAFLVPQGLAAQPTAKDKTPPPLTRILFVFDGSQSMFGRWESGPKIDVAQRLIGQMLDSLQTIQGEGNFQLALRVYGHQRPVPPQDCSDTRLEVPFGMHNIPRIKKVLRAIQPKGTTPIAQSLMASADDFPPCDRARVYPVLIPSAPR